MIKYIVEMKLKPEFSESIDEPFMILAAAEEMKQFDILLDKYVIKKTDKAGPGVSMGGSDEVIILARRYRDE